jgi:hypothetical protein
MVEHGNPRAHRPCGRVVVDPKSGTGKVVLLQSACSLTTARRRHELSPNSTRCSGTNSLRPVNVIDRLLLLMILRGHSLRPRIVQELIGASVQHGSILLRTPGRHGPCLNPTPEPIARATQTRPPECPCRIYRPRASTRAAASCERELIPSLR